MSYTKKIYILPRKRITVNGRKVAAVGFNNRASARAFVKKRHLKGVVVLGRRKGR